MRRRICLIAMSLTALLALASETFSQQVPRVARVGMLCGTKCTGPIWSAFDDELLKLGWVEGQNLTIERRAAESRFERLPELAAELVRLKPDVMFATSLQPVRAANNATSEIPIVFSFVADPVRVGLVKSLARPGGNVTGVATLVPGAFIAKSLQLIRELLPKAQRIAALLNPSNEIIRHIFSIEAPPAVALLGFQIDTIEVAKVEEIADAIEGAKARGADALYVVGDPLFHSPPERIPNLSARISIPAMYLPREMVQAGGLMAYSSDFMEVTRRSAHVVDRVLRGAHPSELPVEQPTRYELVINLKTAKALGLTVPSSLLARADEVIE